MKELHSETVINASAKKVWAVLTDFASFSQWNPFIKEASGEAKEGARLKIRIHPPGGSAMSFSPTVLKVENNRELRWLGNLVMPGLFDGEHIFCIEPQDANRVRFIQREMFRGLLVPILSKSLDQNTQRGFEAMNKALKERVEKAD
jgi:hypothetical protein